MSEVSIRDGAMLRFEGRIADMSPADRRVLLDRSTSASEEISRRTAEIVERVRVGGDDALRELAQSFDGIRLESIEVPREVRRAALDRLDRGVRRAMERAARNLAAVHGAFLPQAVETSPEPGIVIGRRPDPLARVGVYAPGGRAAYPSSVLMGAIPARVAQVGEVVLCSPPDASGAPSPAVLAAAELAEVDRVFSIGGAGAIAAMAFGTETVPRVDRVVGPGNAYVAEAKIQLVGSVAIDSPAGPSELLVVADDDASPQVVASELLAQAEHDPLACVVLVGLGERILMDVRRLLAEWVGEAPRRQIISQALMGQGALLLAASLDEAVAFAADYAPEHLLLAMRDADRALPRFRNAGTVFVGETASVSFGDYMTGANHVLPTGGLARAYSGLSVLDFVRWTTYQRIDADAAARLADDVAAFAEAEALPGHAASARQWSRR